MKNNLNICNDYKNRDKRIVVIDKKYSGLSDSRNTGIQYATGDYIGFVDSDDYIDKSMYKKLLFMSEKYNSGISMCDFVQTFNDHEKNSLYRKIF